MGVVGSACVKKIWGKKTARVFQRGIRRMNILMGTLHTALVAWSAIGEMPVPFYMFFATIEIAGTLSVDASLSSHEKRETGCGVATHQSC
jgi:hypothetical protein